MTSMGGLTYEFSRTRAKKNPHLSVRGTGTFYRFFFLCRIFRSRFFRLCVAIFLRSLFFPLGMVLSWRGGCWIQLIIVC